MILSFFSAYVFGKGINDEVEFVLKTQHLDFSAPRSCAMRIETGGKSLSGSYRLNDRSCKLDESELTKKDPALSKKVDIFVCAMLVPALNTTGRDFFGSCSVKKVEGDLLKFSKCGPKKNIITELNVNQLTITSHIDGISNEFLANKYQFVSEKLYPQSLELKSALYHQKIARIDYDNNVPRFIQADENGNNLKISFSNCVKNH